MFISNPFHYVVTAFELTYCRPKSHKGLSKPDRQQMWPYKANHYFYYSGFRGKKLCAREPLYVPLLLRRRCQSFNLNYLLCQNLNIWTKINSFAVLTRSNVNSMQWYREGYYSGIIMNLRNWQTNIGFDKMWCSTVLYLTQSSEPNKLHFFCFWAIQLI